MKEESQKHKEEKEKNLKKYANKNYCVDCGEECDTPQCESCRRQE